jgi:NADP-dependent 3-hydroxy acid dehydrogenase YdfG
MKKIAFITGATSGIGKACAETFAEKGYNLILCGRRSERLSLLQQELIKKYAVEILCSSFDVQNQSEVTNAILSIPDKWKKIDCSFGYEN